jgi:hypothetical protein
VFCFKSGHIRIACFYSPRSARRTIVLTNAFRKQCDRTRPQDLDRSITLRNAYFKKGTDYEI